MSENTKSPEDRAADPDKVSCDVCRAEIPKATAQHAEGQNYVHYFCGPACFLNWAGEDKPEPGKP